MPYHNSRVSELVMPYHSDAVVPYYYKASDPVLCPTCGVVNAVMPYEPYGSSLVV